MLCAALHGRFFLWQHPVGTCALLQADSSVVHARSTEVLGGAPAASSYYSLQVRDMTARHQGVRPLNKWQTQPGSSGACHYLLQGWSAYAAPLRRKQVLAGAATMQVVHACLLTLLAASTSALWRGTISSNVGRAQGSWDQHSLRSVGGWQAVELAAGAAVSRSATAA